MQKIIACGLVLVLAGCGRSTKQLDTIEVVDAHNELRRVKQFRLGLNDPFGENYVAVLRYAQPGSLTHQIAQRNVADAAQIRAHLMEEIHDFPFKPITPQEARHELIRIQQDRLIFVRDFAKHYQRIVDACAQKKDMMHCEIAHYEKAKEHVELYKKMIARLEQEVRELQAESSR